MGCEGVDTYAFTEALSHTPAVFHKNSVSKDSVLSAGNRVAAPKEEEVDPEAVTDDDLAEEGPPSGHITKDKPTVGLQQGAIATKALNSIKPAEAQVCAVTLPLLQRGATSLACKAIQHTLLMAVVDIHM